MFKELGRDNRLIMAALFIWALGEGLWYNLRQLYLVELGATPAQVGTVLAIESIARALLPLPAGYAADRFGPHRVMVLSWMVGFIGPAGMALATSWQLALPGIVIYSLSAFAIPAISTYALLSLPNRDLPGIANRTLTAIYAAYPAGLIISPALGGLIADSYGIRTNLWLGTALFAVSTLTVLMTRSVRPRVAAHELRPGDLLRNGAYLRLVLYYAATALIMQLGLALAPNFLRDVRGFSLSTIGLLLSIFSLGTVVLNLLSGRASPRWNYPAILLLFWLSLLVMLGSTSWAGVAIAFFGLGGFFTTRALATAGVARAVGESNQGLAFGMFESLFSVSLAIAAQAAGSLYDLTPSHDLPFVAGLAGLPLMIGLWFVVRSLQMPARDSLEASPTPGD
ncbi:MAG TPA: MFS transporter [Chloroflexi bacterium]|nr:MFS transporter [Chloroflexota bacterium]